MRRFPHPTPIHLGLLPTPLLLFLLFLFYILMCNPCRGLSAPFFLRLPSAGRRGSPALFSHDAVIIFGTVHIFSNVIITSSTLLGAF